MIILFLVYILYDTGRPTTRLHNAAEINISRQNNFIYYRNGLRLYNPNIFQYNDLRKHYNTILDSY